MKTVSYELAKEMLDTLHYAAGCLDTDGNDPIDLMIYKAESAMAEPQPAADGWITWEGGECPVAGDTVVEIRCRNLVSDSGEADSFDWDHLADSGYNVIAYRIVEGD